MINLLFRRLNAFVLNLAGLAEAEGRVALLVGGRVLRVLVWWGVALASASAAGVLLTVGFMWLLADILGWPLALLLAGIWLAVAAAAAAWMGVRSALPPAPMDPSAPPAPSAASAPPVVAPPPRVPPAASSPSRPPVPPPAATA